MRELQVALATKKARLRVRVTQLRRQRANDKCKAINTAYRQHGPSCLSSMPRGDKVGINHPTADEVSQFWKGVIRVEGDFDSASDETLAAWILGDSDTPVPRDIEPVNIEVWGKAMRRVKSWKAPGRDGICGFWWKSFHQASTLLRRIMWDMLEEGEADSIPAWFVKGRTVLIPKEG